MRVFAGVDQGRRVVRCSHPVRSAMSLRAWFLRAGSLPVWLLACFAIVLASGLGRAASGPLVDEVIITMSEDGRGAAAISETQDNMEEQGRVATTLEMEFEEENAPQHGKIGGSLWLSTIYIQAQRDASRSQVATPVEGLRPLHVSQPSPRPPRG